MRDAGRADHAASLLGARSCNQGIAAKAAHGDAAGQQIGAVQVILFPVRVGEQSA